MRYCKALVLLVVLVAIGYAGLNLCLWAAAAAGNAKIARYVLLLGANVNFRGPQGRTPLMNAASENRLEVAVLLIRHGADVNAVSGDNRTPLGFATGRGHNDMVALLLDNGANIEIGTRIPQWTPLMEAAAHKFVATTSLLLSRGASVRSRSTEGKTALMYAVQTQGNSDVIKLLVTAGADLDATDSNGKTALMLAQGDENVKLLRKLGVGN